MTNPDGMETLASFSSRLGFDAGLTTDGDGNAVQQDISGGVETDVSNVDAVTIYLDVAGAVNVTVEFSPDDGANWYEPAAESPVEFSSAGTDLVHVEYNVDRLRLTGSDSTGVKAQIREVV